MTPLGPIAVYGATGQQGGAVLDALLAKDATVRALVRDPASDRAQVIAQRGVELVQADADEPASLVPALDGVQALFFMTTPPGGVQTEDTEGETQQGIALADAAKQAGVPHVVYSSVGGAERETGVPHFESKRRVEEHLESLGVPTALVRPAFFMENLLGMSPSLENGEIVVRLPLPDAVPLQMIAVKDIGAVAATALLEPQSIPDGAIEIAGDELTGSQIAATYAKHTGMPARYEALPLSVLDDSYDMQAMFRWFADSAAYQADLAQVRALIPELLDLPAWLRTVEVQPGA
ncbi:NmrA/HSCARG family protein [Brachybacterium alimentarium]|uniref:NmrA/HSCARG family protein n=1 Tax=Brachybacterium alimentarium TaxID=47845 RepID=UPI000DF1F4C4|nr:NmrA/HSCARG family protein [Brachybacterium alimentarium]RCS75061.1 NmrA/HSCARG family protein [Brachybacterium alimentarium]RCS92300.1 NmrA/HSCARG family protein [Brachybacterium alimentarium]